MKRFMLVLVGFGALFVVGCAQFDEKQYDDFLSEVRNWQEQAERVEALVTYERAYERATRLNHNRLSDIMARPQPDSRVRDAQADICKQIRTIEHHLRIYSLAWSYFLNVGTQEAIKGEDGTDSRQRVYLDAQRRLHGMIRNYVYKRWQDTGEPTPEPPDMGLPPPVPAERPKPPIEKPRSVTSLLDEASQAALKEAQAFERKANTPPEEAIRVYNETVIDVYPKTKAAEEAQKAIDRINGAKPSEKGSGFPGTP